MNLLLFGPPGIGKSTIIKRLSYLKTVDAVDLEKMHFAKGATLHKMRLDYIHFLYQYLMNASIMRSVKPVIVGAAALDPAMPYPGFKKVLLIMPQAEYEDRRAARDANQPGKANQRAHRVSDWRKGVHYDFTVDVSQPLASVCALIRRIASEE